MLYGAHPLAQIEVAPFTPPRLSLSLDPLHVQSLPSVLSAFLGHSLNLHVLFFIMTLVTSSQNSSILLFLSIMSMSPLQVADVSCEGLIEKCAELVVGKSGFECDEQVQDFLGSCRCEGVEIDLYR